MEFEKQICALGEKINDLKSLVKTEEATKHSFVMPFLQILGYDIFDPTLIVPEFTADAGKKKGEKVDYAIMYDDNPIILIEVKKHTENLDNHIDQLYRYFSVLDNKFAILTNGIEYRFFTESETNRMDKLPFLQFDIRTIKKREIASLKRFANEELDMDSMISLASKRKYVDGIKEIFEEEITNPSTEFIKVFATRLTNARLTKPVLDEFSEHITSSFKEIITDLANQKINAIKNELTSEAEANEDGIITTDEEIQGFFIVKSILAEVIDLDKIGAKDTKNYFGILFENNTRKWICRLYFNNQQKYITMQKKDKEKKYPINKLEDIYKHSEVLKEIGLKYLWMGNT